jgi:hypothetical protein
VALKSKGKFMNIESHGTRAKGTDSLVFRVLSSESYRTLEVVERFMLSALVGQALSSDIARRAQNILDRIAKYGESAIPKDALDLVAWSDLAVSGATVKRESRKASRHYVNCKHCKKRFLANRAGMEFCGPKCRVRWNRANPVIRESAQSLSEAA